MSFLCLKDPLPWLIRLYLSLVTPPLLLPVSPISRMDTVLQSLARLSSVLPIPSSLNPSASSTNSTPKTDPQYVHLHCTVFVQGTYFLLKPAAQGVHFQFCYSYVDNVISHKQLLKKNPNRWCIISDKIKIIT